MNNINELMEKAVQAGYHVDLLKKLLKTQSSTANLEVRLSKKLDHLSNLAKKADQDITWIIQELMEEQTNEQN